ncbi:MAG: alpha-amylase family glycosyl hydrolase [Candidatus Nanopelagicales bacterium]
MAIDTPRSVRELVIYQVFPRNFGPTGRLPDVTAELDRIVALGVDVLYLMPIHPIGEVGRKGSLGSPYAISDYRALHPELASPQEFAELLAAAHERGLKVMIDVVFNHTSPDSVLVAKHPEFFHQDRDGVPITTVPAWTDIIDLNHPHPGLWRYLIESLRLWVEQGVDGFRCDVASLVPVEFWVQARTELRELNPDLLWLAESPHPRWVSERRKLGLPTWSDAEMYAAFDMTYEYDLWSLWQCAVTGEESLTRYVEMLRWQEAALPTNAAKLRFVENHDQFRIMHFAPDRAAALAWTAFAGFNAGPFMIYAGQESAARHWVNLFDSDPVRWGEYELAPFLTKVAAVKKHPAVVGGTFWPIGAEPGIVAVWGHPAPGTEDLAGGLLGVFNPHGSAEAVAVPLPDGDYADLLGGAALVVRDGQAALPASAAIIEFAASLTPRPAPTNLLDVFLHVEALGDEGWRPGE